MPWNRYVLGYHGCPARIVRGVISGERPLRPSKNEYDWLGNGIYFWEESPERARQWGRDQGFSRVGVIGAVIDLGNCLNLTDAESLATFQQAYESLKKAMRKIGKPLPRNTGSGFLSRKLDCAVFESLHQTMLDERAAPFDTVRAFFVEGKPLYRNAGIRHLDHVQICVRNAQRIRGYFLPRP